MIVFDDWTAGATIMAKVQGCYHPQTDRVVARYRGEKLLGGAVFQQYAGASIHAHFAGFDPHWLNRDLLWTAFHYAFVQLNCQAIIIQVDSQNTKSLNICLKMGYKQRFSLPRIFPDGGDLVVLTMTREDCRWLNLSPKGIKAGH